jgi:hypothetical protein
MKIENAKQLPKRYFGLHMVEGVAEYKDKASNTDEAFRIFIGETTLKNMNSTFEGKPVYVHHVDYVKLDEIQNADGYVLKSFYNKTDGKQWAEFIIVSDRGHEAIRMGWTLSNTYVLKNVSGGGDWHGVAYNKEVTEGEYEHLAIVPNPRYQESVIFTPDEFKTYNQNKEIELTKLANSNKTIKGATMKLDFWNKKKVENGADFESMSVTLPKSKKEVTLISLVNDADSAEMKKDEKVFANGEHRVKVGEEEMSVNELTQKYSDMCNAAKPPAEDEAENLSDEDAKSKALELAAHEEDEMKKSQSESDDKESLNAEDDEEKEKEVEEKAKNEKNEKAANFKKLKNAPQTFEKENVIELSSDRTARGQKRYGSTK